MLIGGLYRDGSYLAITDKGTQNRVGFEGLKYFYDNSESCINSIHCQMAWSYDRSFIQLKNGIYAYGNNLKKSYNPVDVPYKDLELDMALESSNYKLTNFIKEAL